MWYYILIIISVVMFSGSFGLQDVYRKMRGSGLKISMESSFIGSLAGLVVLMALNGFSFECTPFTLLMASWAACNAIAFTFCSFRALDYINLSLFSLFAMLGGMVLPFFQGILFYNEGFTLAKGICVIFICLALLCTVEKGSRSRGTIFYAGIFILNGMSGVISKIFTSSDLPKASAVGYSVLMAMITVLLSGVAWFVMAQRERQRVVPAEEPSRAINKKVIAQSYGVGALYGGINRVANFMLVLALVHVDASVQYPMVTGGTMIASTIISCFGEKKPSRREILSVCLAFAGMLVLFLVPA